MLATLRYASHSGLAEVRSRKTELISGLRMSSVLRVFWGATEAMTEMLVIVYKGYA
jgi:hypothetical protein